jgi:tRNA threonylcarbamoyl adenosine modification protein YeaZ
VTRWLGLDGALGAFSAALVSDDGIRTANASGNDALERGLALVDDVLGGLRIGDLSGIAVGTGPGGFTGLRIAVGYAKSLAFAGGVPLAGVSSYDALEEPGTPPPYATFVHGRAGIACVRYTPKTGVPTVACGTYAQLAERLEGVLGRTTLRAFAVPAGALPALGERGIDVQPIPFEIAVPALAIAERARSGAAVAGDPHAVRADYGEPHYGERGRHT